MRKVGGRPRRPAVQDAVDAEPRLHDRGQDCGRVLFSAVSADPCVRSAHNRCAMEDVVVVPDETVAATFAITENDYTGKPFGYLEWRAAVRQMRRIYGDEYAK